MPLNVKNLEHTVRLALAVQQRFGTIQEIASRLQDPRFFRSTDGELVVGQLTDADLDVLEKAMIEYLDQVEVAAAAIRGMMAERHV